MFLILVDKPRGEGHVREFTEDDIRADMFWQDVGDTLGGNFDTAEEAQAVLDSWFASLPARD